MSSFYGMTWAEVFSRNLAYLNEFLGTEKAEQLSQNQREAVIAAIERGAEARRRYGDEHAATSSTHAMRVWETACAIRMVLEPSYVPPWEEWLLALACIVRDECADAAGKDNEMYVRKVDIDSITEHHGLPPCPVDAAAFAHALRAQRLHDYDAFISDIGCYLRNEQGRRQRLGVPAEPPPPPEMEEEPLRSAARRKLVDDLKPQIAQRFVDARREVFSKALSEGIDVAEHVLDELLATWVNGY